MSKRVQIRCYIWTCFEVVWKVINFQKKMKRSNKSDFYSKPFTLQSKIYRHVFFRKQSLNAFQSREKNYEWKICFSCFAFCLNLSLLSVTVIWAVIAVKSPGKIMICRTKDRRRKLLRFMSLIIYILVMMKLTQRYRKMICFACKILLHFTRS